MGETSSVLFLRGDKKLKVYYADVSPLNDDALYQAFSALVWIERAQKAERYRFRSDRNLSLGAAALLWYGSKQIAPDAELHLAVTEHEQPYFENMTGLHFSLSHSGHYAMVAFSDYPIGCDIEQPGNLDMRIAKRFFCASEYNLIASQMDENAQREMFYQLWTIKESYLKAIGLGLALPMNNFEVRKKSAGWEIVRDGAVVPYHVASYDLPEGFHSSLCTQEMPHIPQEISLRQIITEIG